MRVCVLVLVLVLVLVRAFVAYVCKCRPITSKAGRGPEIGWALGLVLCEWLPSRERCGSKNSGPCMEWRGSDSTGASRRISLAFDE